MDEVDVTYICIYIHIHVIYIHTYPHTMEYYSAEKKEIMPFAVSRMELEIVRLGEVSQQRKANII